MVWSLILSYLIVIIILFYAGFNFQIKNFLIRKQSFSCKRCGRCCKLLLKLNEEDIERIKTKGHKDFHVVKKGKCCMKRINDYCIFLKLNKGICSCSIYEYRPKICKKFPKLKSFGKAVYDHRCNAFKRPRFLRLF